MLTCTTFLRSSTWTASSTSAQTEAISPNICGKVDLRDTFCALNRFGRTVTKLSKKARGDERWKVVNVALGAIDGTQTFNVIKTGEQNVLSSFLNLRDAEVLNSFVTLQNEHERTHTEEVRVRRLDGILPELLPKDEWQRIFLKMDTQGYDLKVFDGSRGILPHVVSLQSEISVRPLYHDMPSYRESLRVYEEAGFEVMNLFVVNRTNNGAVLEYDCLMARDGAGRR